MKKILALLLLVVSTSAFADCSQFFAWGQPRPKDSKPRVELCRIAYFTLWDPSTKNPTYSSELLLLENVSGIEDRSNSFYSDPNVQNGSTNRDFVKTGYDKGHLAPAGDFRATSAMMQQSFYLTNTAPEWKTLNRIKWKQLEGATRKTVRSDRPVYVTTGVYGKIGFIGNNVDIPQVFYKVVYDKISSHLACYAMMNTDGVKGKLDTYLVPCVKLETDSNMEFFPNMPPEVRARTMELPLSKDW